MQKVQYKNKLKTLNWEQYELSRQTINKRDHDKTVQKDGNLPGHKWHDALSKDELFCFNNDRHGVPKHWSFTSDTKCTSTYWTSSVPSMEWSIPKKVTMCSGKMISFCTINGTTCSRSVNIVCTINGTHCS